MPGADVYSIAVAQRSLPELVARVEEGAVVRLMRGGTCVAVLVSPEREAAGAKPEPAGEASFASAQRELSRRFPGAAPGIGPGHFRTFRSRELGRGIHF